MHMRMMHGMHGGMADPAAMDAHVNAMLKQMVPDATPDQTARLKAAMKAIHGDMGAVHARFEQTHERLHALLLAPVIDRAALEKVRAEQIGQINQTSRQLVNEMVDAAEVLTPAQRTAIAAKLKAHKG
jgi:Spy/CpxP family protein refolding chaperone